MSIIFPRRRLACGDGQGIRSKRGTPFKNVYYFLVIIAPKNLNLQPHNAHVFLLNNHSETENHRISDNTKLLRWFLRFSFCFVMSPRGRAEGKEAVCVINEGRRGSMENTNPLGFHCQLDPTRHDIATWAPTLQKLTTLLHFAQANVTPIFSFELLWHQAAVGPDPENTI